MKATPRVRNMTVPSNLYLTNALSGCNTRERKERRTSELVPPDDSGWRQRSGPYRGSRQVMGGGYVVEAEDWRRL